MRNYFQRNLIDKFKVKLFVFPGIAASGNLSLTHISRMEVFLLS